MVFIPFFYEVDLKRMLGGTSWFFNNHLVLMKKILPGEDPMTVPLEYAEFWIQIHDLPPGLVSEAMARQFGNFLGEFLEYDTTVSLFDPCKYMRIKACIDSRFPLKRRKKILVGDDRVVYARFQYERLSLFCFLRGKLGHGESFYPFRIRIDSEIS